MLKFFEHFGSCDIVLDLPLHVEDTLALKNLFAKEYNSWYVKFGRVYNIDTDMIKLLHLNIFKYRKNIKITTHKHKLNRYLHQLGFDTIFESLISQDVLNIDDIEVVLIGGSADSSEKIVDIVKNTSLVNLALVIVQHVEPDKKGIFDEILQRLTTYKVSYVKDGQKIEKARIYIAPNDKHLKVENGFFTLSDEDKYNHAKPSVSVSYESFSSYYKGKLLVIQECGYAADGVDKMKYLKSLGSKLIIQDKKECEATPMLTNAMALHVEDYVLNIDEIIIYINLLDKNKDALTKYLLDMIFKIYGYDFRLYHKDMIKRRIDMFMLKHDIKTMRDAVGVILFNRSAFKGFFLEVSINVTEFFRHPELLKQVVVMLNNNYKNAHNIKVWSAGCSTGEEVYSSAIILDNLNLLDKSIIYATDFNSVVLEEAKNGIYSKDSYILAKENFKKIGLNENLNNYVEIYDNFVILNEKIRKKTHFFKHNLATDGSFNEFDIIICKNVIIYFDNDLQEKVFKLFYDSLKFGGHLILGESEIINQKYLSKFEQCGKNYKIFKKVA